MLLVNGSVFRIMRWDRSGVIVSEAVEYAKTTDHTRVLLELLFGLSKMSLVGAGLDPTTMRLSRTSCGWQRMQFLSFASSLDLNENEVIQKRSSDRAVNAIRQTYRAATAPTSSLFTAGKLHKDPRSLCSGRTSSNVSVKESFDEALSNHLRLSSTFAICSESHSRTRLCTYLRSRSRTISSALQFIRRWVRSAAAREASSRSNGILSGSSF